MLINVDEDTVSNRNKETSQFREVNIIKCSFPCVYHHWRNNSTYKICIETFEKKKSIINYLNITQKKSNYLNIQVVQKKKKEKNWIIEIQARAEIR